MIRYQKGKTNLDFTGASDSQRQWYQLGLCKSAPRSIQITTSLLEFFTGRMPLCRPTNSVKALKAKGGIEDRKQKAEGQKITKGRSSRRMEKEQEEVKG